MTAPTAPTDPTAPAGPVPDGAQPPLRHTSLRAACLAAAGLALAGAALVASLPPPPGPTGQVRPPGGAPPAAHAQDAGDLDTVSEPETCSDGVNAGLDAATSYAPSTEVGDAVRRIQDAGRLVVGVDQNSYRWGYRDPDSGDLVGFDIDLVKAIAESLLGPDPVIVYKAIPTAQREDAIREHEVDMVVRSMSITCARWERVAFSAAYFQTGQQLLAPVTSDITGVNETLDGHTVCAGEDTTAHDELRRRQRQLPDMKLITRTGHLDCLVAIQLGEADALMTDSALAAGHVAQDPTVELKGEPITQESYGVAMNLADVDLVRWVNDLLESYTAGGNFSEWHQSFNTWLADYMPPQQPPEPRYRD